MTTTVTVKTHEWEVDVTPYDLTRKTKTYKVRVPKNTEQTFFVHCGSDLIIHEVQPNSHKVGLAETITWPGQ